MNPVLAVIGEYFRCMHVVLLIPKRHLIYIQRGVLLAVAVVSSEPSSASRKCCRPIRLGVFSESCWFSASDIPTGVSYYKYRGMLSAEETELERPPQEYIAGHCSFFGLLQQHIYSLL